MLADFQYMKYIARHKWFVFIAGRKLGVSLWLLLLHDWSKFRWSEWRAYRDYFYRRDTGGEYFRAIAEWGLSELAPYGFYQKERFNIAWLHHQHRNKHHWQYWVLRQDDGPEFSVSMPDKYIREMVADWAGAGRAITGKWDLATWYEGNKDKIMLRDEVRNYAESLIALLPKVE